jgi:hypothetical protein
MTRLIALYPRAWRDRYENEFLALLQERTPEPRDRFDIVRGAVDARLHPQAGRSSSGEPDGTRSARLDAVLAVLAGALWVATGLAFQGSSVDPDLGYKDTELALLLGIAGALVAGLTALVVSFALPGRHLVASISSIAVVIGALAMVLPWPVVALGFYTTTLGVLVFGLVAWPRVGPAGVLLALAALVALGFNTEDERALLLVPLGAAWILVGVFLAVRRAPARVSSPPVGG